MAHAPRGRRKLGEPPPYLCNADGRGYATLDGERHYFGPYHSTEAREDYERFRLGWLAKNRPSLVFSKPGRPLREILPAYLQEVESALGAKEFVDVKRNLETVVSRFGDLRPDDFRAAQFKAIREDWMRAGHCRHTIGKACGRIKRWFAWMVEHEFASPETHGLLLAIRGLRPGMAPDNPPVEPVSVRDYVRTIRRVTAPVRAIARVQLFGGPRPGEVCRMRGCELHRSGRVKIGHRSFRVPHGVWVFVPEKQGRSKKRGKPTVYLFGPRVQAVIRPFLRDDGDYLFQPRENGDPKNRSRGTRYLVSSYSRAIERAANKAGAAHWHPHQLRHAFTTRMDAATDALLTVSTLLSHERPDTTLIYLQRKLGDAAAAAAKHG